MKLVLVNIDTKYCNYLRKFDNKVPYNFDKKKNRPFVGVLFKINDCMYFAPLSSPKSKHLKLKDKLDFLKIDNGTLGAVNFNNMIPVNKQNIVKIDLNIKYNDASENNYLNLLKKQIYWLNRHADKLYKSSKKIYEQYCNGTLNENIKKRCCNFILLEEKCKLYKCD